MSYSDPNHPPTLPGSFMPLPVPCHDVGGSWPQFPVNPDGENEPPFKRAKNSGNSPPNSSPFPPMNPRFNPLNSNFPGGRGMGHIFYKTRMCGKFLEGTCRNGEHCTFAHGIEDLREPPPNWQELVREKDRGLGNWNDDQRVRQRMKICRRYYNGDECPYGENCTFLHERPVKFKDDMARQGSSFAVRTGTTGPILGRGSGAEQPESMPANSNPEAFRVNNPGFWRSRICSRWEMSGQCNFGERCHYAHGHQSELNATGADVEAEPVVKSGSIPPTSLSMPDLVPSAQPIANAPSNEGANNKMSKWKLTKKINRIYADWLDDLAPSDDLPSKSQA